MKRSLAIATVILLAALVSGAVWWLRAGRCQEMYVVLAHGREGLLGDSVWL